MAEALAIVGAISSILQIADFCTKVGNRAVEFAGRSAQLPGSFSSLRVVLAVVRLNMRKLKKRLENTEPDDETLETLKDLVTLIEQDITQVQIHLEKLPPAGASWAKVTITAMSSVFNEGKLKRAVDSIMQNTELLSQTVTASLPTAEEIAKAVQQQSMASGIDRKLSLILSRMQTNAMNKANQNRQAFESQAQENRTAGGLPMQIKGSTHVNNTFITVNVPYGELGAQLDRNGGNTLTVPNQDIPFYPLKHAISNPHLTPKSPDPSLPVTSDVVAAPLLDIIPNSPLDLAAASTRPTAARSNTTKTYRNTISKSTNEELFVDGYQGFDGDTVIGSDSAFTLHPSKAKLAEEKHALAHLHATTYPTSPKPSLLNQPPDEPPPAYTAYSVPAEQLHNNVFELDSSMPPLTKVTSPSTYDSLGETQIASDTCSETTSNAHSLHYSSAAQSTVSTSSIGSADTAAFETVNAFLRQGASAVNANPSEAKRAYLRALNASKAVVSYTPESSVRKFRALTQAAIGLALSTGERQAWLAKARGYNEQALSAACAARDSSLESKVLLDEADLQMHEARRVEKEGKDATMQRFAAFGAYQTLASRITESASTYSRRSNVPASWPQPLAPPRQHQHQQQGGSALAQLLSIKECNTQAEALIGCGKAAALLSKNAGTFRSAHGPILSSRAYYEQALAACKAGFEISAQQAAAAQARGDADWAAAPAPDLAILKETEERVMRCLVAK